MTPTREQIIELADHFIRQKGFHGFSYADISGVMDVRNAAVHYHFPAKSDLGEAVIAAELEKIGKARAACRHLPAGEQLRQLVTIFYHHCERRELCLNGALSADYYTFTASMQQRLAEMCAANLDWAGECFEKGRSEGRLHFEGTAADRAMLLMSTLLSSLLLSRVLTTGVFARTLDRLLQDMGIDWKIADLPPADGQDKLKFHWPNNIN